MIESDHLEAAGNAIILRDALFSGEGFNAFKQLGLEAKKHGSLIIGQLSHTDVKWPIQSRNIPCPLATCSRAIYLA